MYEISNNSKKYFDFIKLLAVTKILKKVPALDPLEERLLTLLGSAWHEDGKVKVLEAMVLCDGISTTTAHRRLKSLRLKGLIELISDEKDNRIKYVVPTEITSKYFSALGECMVMAAVG
jgi:hypothetical protein